MQKLASHFMPATDDVFRLLTQSDAECGLFQKIVPQSNGLRQGTYALTPGGSVLASTGSTDRAQIEEMLRQAIAKWEKLAPAERRGEEPAPAALTRYERHYPQGGLVLRVNSRDLPRQYAVNDWRTQAWNQDYAWFSASEMRQFVPLPSLKGTVPLALVRRLLRFHLIDNVRGQADPFDDGDIKRAQLSVEAVRVAGNVVTLRYEGDVRTAKEGTWPVRGSEEVGPQKRGFDGRLLGFARYDSRQNRFLSFELVALGTRWGGTPYNFRWDDLEPAGIGFALTLAGDSPAERVAPALFRLYGWN